MQATHFVRNLNFDIPLQVPEGNQPGSLKQVKKYVEYATLTQQLSGGEIDYLDHSGLFSIDKKCYHDMFTAYPSYPVM